MSLGFQVARPYALGGGVIRPLSGFVRAIESGFGDDTGRRNIYGYSIFLGALQRLRSRGYIERQQDKAVAVGRQVGRVFGAVGGTAWWRGFEYCPFDFVSEDGRHVPATPGWADGMYGLMRDSRDRGLRLQITAGDLQFLMPDPAQRIEYARLVGQIAVAAGSEVVAAFEINEAEYNGVPDPHEARRIVEAFRSACPGPLIATSTPGSAIYEGSNDEQAALRRAWADGMPMLIVHGARDQGRSTPYIFGEQYWDGDRKPWGRPVLQGEPRGPNPDGTAWPDSQPACNEPWQLFADAAVAAVTGQWLNHFSGPGVGRGEEELDSVYGFAEIPAILSAAIPEDVGGWQITHGNHDAAPVGARLFFGDDGKNPPPTTGPWRIDQAYNDEQVVAVAYGGAGDWDIVPHRPLASYRIYGPYGLWAEGSGTFPSMDASMGCRLITGRFA